MKLLVLSHELPPIGGGGGRAAYDICKELAKRGHDITILTAYMKNLPREELLDLLLNGQADPGLRDDLKLLAGDTTDDLDPLW